jgi:hypothetical protein
MKITFKKHQTLQLFTNGNKSYLQKVIKNAKPDGVVCE